MKQGILLGLIALLVGCGTVVETYNPSLGVSQPQIESHGSVSAYPLAMIEPGTTVVSSSGYTGEAKSTDPASLIAGALLKKGVTRVSEVPKDSLNKLILVSWGISGTRKIGMAGAYAMEVTILMRRASDLKLVYKCSAEGIGATEADDVREATFACLSGLN